MPTDINCKALSKLYYIATTKQRARNYVILCIGYTSLTSHTLYIGDNAYTYTRLDGLPKAQHSIGGISNLLHIETVNYNSICVNYSGTSCKLCASHYFKV